jgi:lysophospholipase L1-like esterase
MSAPDRSWTIAPTLAWCGVALIAGLVIIDGDVSALADRLTSKREAKTAGAAGPTFTASSDPAAAGDDSDLVAKLPAPAAGSHDIGALDDACLDGTEQACKRWAMDAFYRAVSASKAGKLGRALRVSWYGDSVVATDALPGRLRTRLQSELGDGGPGFVYAIAPHRFCHHEAITRGGGDNWLSHAISMSHTSDGFYGPGGASAETNSGRASLKLSAGKITRAELYYLAQPHGGTATVTADGVELVRADTNADAKAPGWASGTIAQGASKIEIKGEGKTRVFGIALENASGAVVDNFGIVSVHVKSFAAHDEAHYSAELAHRGADLIMVMIGANEAQWLHPGRAMKDYQAHYEKLLAPIRKGRPDASCLVVSPTDQAEAKDDGFVSRGVMPHLVEAQRKAAHAQGCAFYSTYDWMGGKGSAAKWFAKKLVSSDFVHPSQAGANKIADALFDALMTGAKHYAAP